VTGVTRRSRTKKLNLWSLEERRNRADVVEVFKMLNGFSAVPFETFFQLDLNNRTRDHTAKIKKNRCRTDLRKHFFSERVVNKWNSLKEETIKARTINSF